MKRPLVTIVCVIALLAIMFIFAGWQHSGNDSPIAQGSVSLCGTALHYDLADTEAKREQGLSGRPALADDESMLFVFPDAGQPGFWMKEMNFPIDIIWLDSQKSIVFITSNLSPATYPSVVYPPSDILYVLEAPAGFAEAHDCQAGQNAAFSI